MLELGAGLGLCSLTVAAAGASEVVASETSSVMAALQCSIARNEHLDGHRAIRVAELTWGLGGEEAALGPGAFDIVSGTDLLYSPSLHAPLLATLRHVLTPGVSTLVLAYEERAGEDAFFREAERDLGLVGEYIDLATDSNDVRVFVGARVQGARRVAGAEA